MQAVTDERAGLPSASGMERLKLCPGSWALEQQCPEPPETEEAKSGTRIHDAWAGKLAESELTADEVETLDRIKFLEQDALKAVYKDAPYHLLFRDSKRLWMVLHEPFQRVASGLADAVYNSGSHWGDGGEFHYLLLDAKTGRNETPIASDNLQLRALAAALYDNAPVHSITVGILAPWQSQRITLARYERHHLDAARREILDIIAASKKPDAPRRPSIEACRYCRARGVCPEARAVALALPVAETPELPTPTRTPEAFAAALTGDELSACLTRGRLFDRIHEAIRDEAKRRLTAGETVPGWKLKPGEMRTTITDPQAVFRRFAALGGTAEQFMRAVKVTNGKLESAVRDVTGAKGAGLKQTMAALVEGASEEKETSPSLKEV